MGGDHHLEEAWLPNLVWALDEALEVKERVALQPSVAEKNATCSVEVVLCSSSSTVLVNEKKSSCINIFVFLFFVPLCFGM